MFRKVLALFPREERWKMAALFAAMLVTGVIQTLGIASVMPFIALVANPGALGDHAWLRWMYATFGFETERQFLIFVGIVVVVVFAAGNALAALTSWLGLRFVWSNHHRIAERLLERYLWKPYSFFLGRHGARLTKTLLSEILTVVEGVVVPCLEVASKGVAALLMIALLIAMDPALAALVSASLGGAYVLIYQLVRRRQKRLGERQVAARLARYRVASEAFGGIKDVKVLGREASFLARFSGPSLEFSMTNASHGLVRQLPPFALETIAFGGLLTVLLYLLQTRESLDRVLPIIALYGLAGNRLLPTFHQIFSGITSIRFHTAALDELYADLTSPSDVPARIQSLPAPKPDRKTAGSEIRFRDVSFVYPGTTRSALNHVDLLMPKETMVGLVGPSGCGKTTLVDLLLGLYTPSTGEVLIDGVTLDATTMALWRSRLGYVPQSIFLCDDTITRNIAYGIPDAEIDHAAVERAARAAHLHEFVSKQPEGYKTVVGERGVRISGGERQRIGIARALYHQPDVLVFDEATSALDTLTEEAVMEATHQLAENRTIVLIAHRLSTVRHCHVIFMMEDGKVVAQGTYAQLAASNTSFRAMAGLT
ncbi:MAG: ABC transporter ATP-binding protein/permease [Vicinamibacterales bacterium]